MHSNIIDIFFIIMYNKKVINHFLRGFSMKSSIVNGENRGSINNILLKALQSGDKYAYEINKEIETKSEGKFFIKEASLYSGLKRLEASGHITSYWRDSELGTSKRHYYSITEKGINKLNNSHFTWESSKGFLNEIFAGPQQNNTSLNSPSTNQQPSSENKTVEVKKNPFQIEVNPLQQSLFDLSFDNPKQKTENISNSVNSEINGNENITNVNNIDEKIDETDNVEKRDVEKTSENITLNINNEKQDETITIEKISIENTDKEIIENEKVSTPLTKDDYEDIYTKFNVKSYSSSINTTPDKIDISKYLSNNQKENTNSIIFESKQTPLEELINHENKEEDKKLTEKTSDFSVPVQNVNNNNNFSSQEINNTNEEVNIKNIFGSLLVDSKEEKIVEEKNESEVTEEIIEKNEKTELPRIDVDNNINIMLNSGDYKETREKIATPPRVVENEVKTSNNNYSVKQYINNIQKRNILSKATKVEDEVNLDGIKIREYSRMNNKPIKNSNYVYSNKLNFALTACISILIFLESLLGIILLSNNSKLSLFEAFIFTFLIIFSLFSITYYYYKYKHDKLKVQLKNYNFKSSMFYFSIIFVICNIIFICIDIFLGLNQNNLNQFALKILFQVLISSNLIIYPLLKYLFNKMKFFYN